MPVATLWEEINEPCLRMEFIRPWTWDEYYAAAQQGSELVSSYPGEFAVILDFTHNDGRLPENALTHFKNAISTSSTRITRVVVVSKRPALVKLMLRLLTGLIHIRIPIHIASNLHHAHKVVMIANEQSRQASIIAQ